MAKFSKLNLKYIVVQVLVSEETLETIESQNGGLWVEYDQNGTYGDVNNRYNAEYDIFVEPQPKDMNGLSCCSWEINKKTGKYDPPIAYPINYEKENDDAGLIWMWDESLYQSDNTKGWILKSYS